MKRRRFSLVLVLAMISALIPLSAVPAAGTTGELLISEYVEGSSFNKALEIWNGTGASVDLSTYTLELYSNGSPTPSQTLALSGTLADGDVLVLAHPSAAAAIQAEADILNGAVINWNGDDGIVLRNGGTIVDSFGQEAVDPGSQWTGGGQNDTLRRKSDVCAGDTDFTDAFDASVEWDIFAEDTFDGLGSHTADCGGGGGPATPVINEFVANHTGSDTEAFIEIAGDPSTDYSAYTLLEIEGDSTGSGVIDAVIPVGTTNAAGYWTDGEDMENGTLTILLVTGFTGSQGDDLDLGDDGTLDTTPWDSIVDGIAVSDGGGSDNTYAVTMVASFDGGSFTVGGASRIPDGLDTDAVSDWTRNDFDGAGFAGFTGTPEVGEAFNTPGAANEAVPVPPVINEFVANHTGADTEAFVEIHGADATNYSDLTILEIEGDGSGAGVVDAAISVGVTDGGGYWTDDEDMENGTITILLVSGFSGSTGDDLDLDNDGILDSTPWTAVLDGIAVDDGGSGDQTYALTLTASFDGGSFTVGGASRIPDATDTDALSDWTRNDYDGAGFAGFAGSPEIGEAYNTPGEENALITTVGDPFGVCGDAATLIHTIQGAGFASGDTGNQRTVEGVVVGDFEGSPGLGGFYVQEEPGDIDADPATSEGIFVFNGSSNDVNVGDRVRVKGTVTEYFGLTELTGVTDLTVCDTGFTITPTPLTAPLSDADREAVEGMLVTFTDTMYVTDTFNLHVYGETWLGMGRVISQPTEQLPAGPAADALAADNMLHSILLDDGRDGTPATIPYLHPNGTLRIGDTTTGLTGVMSYAFDAYRIQPTETVTFAETNPRPAAPNVGGEIVVASFNVLNYWTTIGCGFECRGAQTPAELAAQTAGLVDAINGMGADIVALEEIENPVGFDYSDVAGPAHTPITTLVDALNAAEGSTVWAWVGPADHYNDYPIRNEIIYRIGAVTPIGSPDAYADPAFDATAPSGDPYARPPLAQTFEAYGDQFTVVVNHFKSKGSACGEPSEGSDGQGNCNLKRVEESLALLDFVTDLQAIDPDVIVVGDLNSYMREDPILTLEGSLVNLSTAFNADSHTYQFFAPFSFPFVGRGTLDHAFATPTAATKVTDVKPWNINSDEPGFLGWEELVSISGGRYHSSDHDPVLIGLALDTTPPEITLSADPGFLWPPNHKMVDVAITLDVVDDSGSATVTLVSVESSEPDSVRKGDKPGDIVIVDDTHFQLRAERFSAEGRTYTITYEATDPSGNTSIGTIEVRVLHDVSELGPGNWHL